MNRLKMGRLSCLALACAWGVGPVMAASPAPTPVPSTERNAAAVQKLQTDPSMTVDAESATSKVVNFHGVMVAIDPATGQLREPSAAEREKLAALMLKQNAQKNSRNDVWQRPANAREAQATIKRSATGLVGLSMRLPQDRVSNMVAERNADGKVSIHHQGDAANVATDEVVK